MLEVTADTLYLLKAKSSRARDRSYSPTSSMSEFRKSVTSMQSVTSSSHGKLESISAKINLRLERDQSHDFKEYLKEKTLTIQLVDVDS